MGDLWVQVVPRNPADDAILNAHINRKTSAEDLAAQTKLLDADPTNPIRHITVAMLQLQAGHLDQAITHLRDALRLDRESAPTHYNLGVALSREQKFDEAITELGEAVRLDPDYAEAHNNLAAMLLLRGRPADAVDHYRRAVALRPESAEAHDNLGRGLALAGRGAEAVAQFRLAATLKPAWAGPLAASAWVQATSPDAAVRNPAEAIRLAERAAALGARPEPTVLDSLAAAYAAGGRFDDAIRTAGLAIGAATESRIQVLADEIRQRLALYQRGQAYVEGR
jgi:Flp pilus assembly protein TadD